MIGIDEVGRGAWAGPMVVAGCYFTENPGFVRGLNDSKKLSRHARELIENDIKSSTIFKVVVVPPKTIDELGLTECTRIAILDILSNMPNDEVIMLDGKYNFLKSTDYYYRTKVEVKADAKYASVMAASILAKVERDRLMLDYDVTFPNYGFSTNVGYGTNQHIESLKKLGSTPIHRESFKPIKKLATMN
jgi:ribonuclease HII